MIFKGRRTYGFPAFFARFSVIFERSEEIKKTTCYAGGGELALASSRKPPVI